MHQARTFELVTVTQHLDRRGGPAIEYLSDAFAVVRFGDDQAEGLATRMTRTEAVELCPDLLDLLTPLDPFPFFPDPRAYLSGTP